MNEEILRWNFVYATIEDSMHDGAEFEPVRVRLVDGSVVTPTALTQDPDGTWMLSVNATATTMALAETRERLRRAALHIRIALEMARFQELGSAPGLAVIVKHPDGNGRIGALCVSDEFLRDVELLVGNLEWNR
jgi:hypothetical protein